MAWSNEAELYRADDRLVIENGQSKLFYDEPITTQDGSISWIRTSKIPLKDDSDCIIGILGIYEDITARKQTEIDLRIAAIAMESQEGTIICDADGVVLRVNQSFVSITGFSDTCVVGKKFTLFKSDNHNDDFYAMVWNSIQHTGCWRGEIWALRENGDSFPAWLNVTAVTGLEGAITHYVGTFSDITQHKQSEDQIKQLAFYDPLTLLPNRRLLTDRLSQALAASGRTGREGALMFIDLDNFKTMNDSQGHGMGDLLLQDVARRLSESFRDADTVARLGGDEFVVVLTDLSPNATEAATQAETVGQKVLNILREPHLIDNKEYVCTPSIGITLFGTPCCSLDDLMKQADIAMYQSKADGRNTLRFFDPALQETIKARAMLESELVVGIQEDHLALYYQPQVDAIGTVIGAEALVRWNHPTRGLISPNEFIPLAEESGLILPLGNWVFQTACRQAALWARSPETSDFILAVNVSARQFSQPNFVEWVLDVVERTKADPKRLKLELTESMLLENVDDIIAKMTALKSVGIGFSLDDFGTGFSSLSYLKRLPLDQLKIDQSFIQDVTHDPDNAIIAGTIITLGQSLGLKVIAEGVETKEQQTFLMENGCQTYQGYLFGRPVPVAEFDQMVSVSINTQETVFSNTKP
jgi:diguanylate cyclase (GGDEF)-like protein/PAS domain S-box-containing protein